MREAQRRSERSHRTDEDDRTAAAARGDMRNGGFGGVPCPGQIDVEDVLPCPIAKLGGRPEREDPGVGHHNVEAAQLGDAVVDGRRQRVQVAHVRLPNDGAPPGPLNQLDRLVEVVVRCEVVVQARYVLTDVHADDVSATASQSQRVTSTLCACDSCDERDLAVESPHRRFLISRRQLEVCRPQHRLQDRRLTTRPERKQSLLAYQQPVFAGTAVLISAPISRASAPAAEDITPEN